MCKGMLASAGKSPGCLYAMYKPRGFEEYLTTGELLQLVNRRKSSVQEQEAKGHIPAPIRVPLGKRTIKLYSPDEVEVIVDFFRRRDPVRNRIAKAIEAWRRSRVEADSR